MNVSSQDEGPITLKDALEIAKAGTVFQAALDALYDLITKHKQGTATEFEKKMLMVWSFNVGIRAGEGRNALRIGSKRGGFDLELFQWFEMQAFYYQHHGVDGMAQLRVDPPPGA
jgi:hypothetical protein